MAIPHLLEAACAFMWLLKGRKIVVSNTNRGHVKVNYYTKAIVRSL